MKASILGLRFLLMGMQVSFAQAPKTSTTTASRANAEQDILTLSRQNRSSGSGWPTRMWTNWLRPPL